MIGLIETFLLLGLLYSFCTIGLSLSFRVANYPDLTIDGSVILGGILAYYGLSIGVNPFLVLLLGLLGGAIAGLMTAIIHNYLHVSKLLSGIITTAFLYSINLRLLTGKANIRFDGLSTIFNTLFSVKTDIHSIIIIFFISVIVVLLLVVFFKTKLGYFIRILGDNESFLAALGKDANKIRILSLCLANGIIGLGGAILIQYKNTVDVNFNAGLMISCLASMVIGETILNPKSTFTFILSGIVGTLVYQLIVSIILFSWSSEWSKFIYPNDIRFITGLLLLIPALIKYKQTGKFQLFKSDW